MAGVRKRMIGYMVWVIYDGHMITVDECGPNFLKFVLRLRENPGKTSTRKLTRPWMEPGPAAWEVTMLPLDHSGGSKYNANNALQLNARNAIYHLSHYMLKYKQILEEIKCRINMGNSCYYSLEEILLSLLLSKNLKVITYKTIIIPVYCKVVKLGLPPWERIRG